MHKWEGMVRVCWHANRRLKSKQTMSEVKVISLHTLFFRSQTELAKADSQMLRVTPRSQPTFTTANDLPPSPTQPVLKSSKLYHNLCCPTSTSMNVVVISPSSSDSCNLHWWIYRYNRMVWLVGHDFSAREPLESTIAKNRVEVAQ